jgi:hypothetical protein
MLQRSLLHPWESTLTSFTTDGIKYNSIDVVHITLTAMVMQASPVPKGTVQAVCVF